MLPGVAVNMEKKRSANSGAGITPVLHRDRQITQKPAAQITPEYAVMVMMCETQADCMGFLVTCLAH